MRKLSSDRVIPRRQDRRAKGRSRSIPSYEIDPPEPLQIFTRLGVLLVIALGFGLVAELLVRLPPLIGGAHNDFGDGPARKNGRALAKTRGKINDPARHQSGERR